MISAILLTAAAGFLVIALWRSHRTARSLSQLTWEDLLSRLAPIESDGVAAVALEYLQPVKGQLGMEPSELWAQVGGSEGLARMRANAEVLIALAAFAQRWNFHEGVIVAERMRHDGLALRRAVRGVTLGVKWNVGKARGAFYVHEAASAYYLMRQRLLALYETSHAGRYPALAAAI